MGGLRLVGLRAQGVIVVFLPRFGRDWWARLRGVA